MRDTLEVAALIVNTEQTSSFHFGMDYAKSFREVRRIAVK